MNITDSKKKLLKAIKKSKTVFIMGHKNLDLDAIGSCIGMCSILNNYKKECYIIIDDKEHEKGVAKILREVDGYYNIIKSEDLPVYLNKKIKKNLLIVVDTNKEFLFQSDKVLEYFDNNIVIIDHHDIDKESIDRGLIINEENVSSASEMITTIANLYNIKLEPHVCTALLAGVILDTNNFTLKTNADTYYTAYMLTAYGASPKKVQYLLKQDIETYAEQQKLMSNIEKVKTVAITKGTQYVIYRREDLAKIADTLLFFSGIEASFVIGKIGKNTVGISARSLGNYDISHILEKLSGGGDSYNGAAVFEDKTIGEVHTLLLKVIKEEGE